MKPTFGGQPAYYVVMLPMGTKLYAHDSMELDRLIAGPIVGRYRPEQIIIKIEVMK